MEVANTLNGLDKTNWENKHDVHRRNGAEI